MRTTRQQTRSAEGGPTDFQGKARQTDGPVRYSAPSLVFESAGRAASGGRRLPDDRGLRRADRQPRPDARARGAARGGDRRAAALPRRARHRGGRCDPRPEQPAARPRRRRARADRAARRGRRPAATRSPTTRSGSSPEQPRRSRAGSLQRCDVDHGHTPRRQQLELPDGATGADAAAAIGPGPRARGARGRGQPASQRGPARARRCATSRAHSPTARTSRSSPTRAAPQALELIRHDAAHVLAAAVMELYEGVKISIGPPIEDGFYYDFEFPDGTASPRPTSRGSKSACARTSRPPSRSSAEDVPVARGARALPRRAPGLQGRADRRPRHGGRAEPAPRAAADGLAVHQRPLHRPLPRPARAQHARPSARSSSARSPAPTGAGTPRGRCSRASTAPPSSPRPSWRSTSSGSSRRGRATTASSDASSGCSPSPRSHPAAAFWMPAGTGVFNALVALSRQMGAERGYREVKTPQIFDAELWQAPQGTGTSTARTCSRSRSRSARWRSSR